MSGYSGLCALFDFEHTPTDMMCDNFTSVQQKNSPSTKHMVVLPENYVDLGREGHLRLLHVPAFHCLTYLRWVQATLKVTVVSPV